VIVRWERRSSGYFTHFAFDAKCVKARSPLGSRGTYFGQGVMGKFTHFGFDAGCVAVRLPKEFEIKASEVTIRKQGASLILTPKPQTWQDYFASAQSLAEDFPEDISDLPLETREDL